MSTTYKCLGNCRRTGMTLRELMTCAGADKCPYCHGQIVDEGTGLPRAELPHPATLPFPPTWVGPQSWPEELLRAAPGSLENTKLMDWDMIGRPVQKAGQLLVTRYTPGLGLQEIVKETLQDAIDEANAIPAMEEPLIYLVLSIHGETSARIHQLRFIPGKKFSGRFTRAGEPIFEGDPE